MKVAFTVLWCNLNYLSRQVFWVREEFLTDNFWSWLKRALKIHLEFKTAVPFWLKDLEEGRIAGCMC